MRAVVCQNQELRVEDRPEPVAGPGQLVLDVRRCGICGSDLHARVHADAVADLTAEVGYDGFMRAADEVILGHEFSGTVVAHGPKTSRRFAEGELVVSVPFRRGEDGGVHLTGLSKSAPGAYAERVVVDEGLTFAVPNGLDADVAALTEPMAVALHAVDRADVSRRTTTVVIGCGPIGLAVILMLKARGVRHVIASDLSPGRRELARRCGADVVVDPRAESPYAGLAERGHTTNVPDGLDLAVDAMRRLRRVPRWEAIYRAADALGATKFKSAVVFECVGAPGILEQIISQAPLATRVAVVGVCMEPDRFRPTMALNKEIELRFMFAYTPLEFRDTLHLLADGKVDPAPLMTATIGLEGVAGAFDVLADAEAHAKILVDPASHTTI